MSSTLTFLAAHEHINDPRREAEHRRAAGERGRSRRARPGSARTGTAPSASADAVTLRFSRPEDDRALEQLAQLDSARAPHGPHLVAEVGGALRAAISLTDGAVIADPFHRTAELVELLRAQARQLPDGRTVGRTPTSVLRRLAGLRKRSWATAS